jgi:hypothetical protein
LFGTNPNAQGTSLLGSSTAGGLFGTKPDVGNGDASGGLFGNLNKGGGLGLFGGNNTGGTEMGNGGQQPPPPSSGLFGGPATGGSS